MPLFHEIVVGQARPALSARSVRDAYLITLNECGGLNYGRMAALLGPGNGPDNVRDVLTADGLSFDDPEAGWQTADAYRSGNVKRKLATAEKAAVAELRFQRKVEALQLVIPSDIPPGQIEVRLGTHWIPPAGVNQFRAEVWTPKRRAGHAPAVISSTTSLKQPTGSWRRSRSFLPPGTSAIGARHALRRCANLQLQDWPALVPLLVMNAAQAEVSEPEMQLA